MSRRNSRELVARALPSWMLTALAFDRSKWRPIAATRAAVGVAAVMTIYTAFGSPSAGLLAELGALNAGIASYSGNYRTRVQTMCITALLMSLATGLGVSVGRSDLATCVAGVAFGFVTAMYSARSATASTIGIQAASIYAVMSGLGLPSESAVSNALVVLSGAAVQIVLLTWIWPMNPLHPEREALADAFASLAKFLRDLPTDEINHIPSTVPLQDARALIGEGASLTGKPEQKTLQQRLELAEAVRAALVGFAAADRDFRKMGRAEALRAKRVSRLLSGQLLALSAQIRRNQPHLRTPARSAPSLQIPNNGPEAERYAKWVQTVVRLLEQEHESIRLPLFRQESVPLQTAAAGWPWALQSVSLHHGARYATALGLALVIARYAHVSHGYWLPLTVAIVLRHDYASTLGRGVARIVGTLFGVAIASLLIDLSHPSPSTLALLTIAVIWLSFGLFQASYAAYSSTITMFVVFSVSASGLAGHGIGATRIFATLGGVALAIAAYVLWPAWHWKQMWQMLEEAVEAQINFIQGFMAGQPNVSVLRGIARSSRLQAETLFQAASMEPRGRKKAGLKDAEHAINELDRNAAQILSIEAESQMKGQTMASEAQPFLDSAQQLKEFVAGHLPTGV